MSGDAAQYTEAIARTMGTRHCSNCQQVNSTEGGGWKVLNAGRNRRWQCGHCWAKWRERQAKAKGA